MPTAFFPKNPNNVSKSRTSARSSLGICPLSKAKVQLIPLRYGLVDKAELDPAQEVAVPYQLSARPLGIRLLRDGWLYVIEGSTGVLSEYRVLDGLVSAMLWQGASVTQDARTQPINMPSLIYDKRSTLYVTYAEAQWTAKKCTQVLNAASERDRFMQAVDLSQADCEKGGPHLLTRDMAEHWLAEVATERLEAEQKIQGSEAFLPEPERRPYLWEVPEQFAEASINRLTGCIDPQYHDDTLYLVLDDTLGVLRDLANYQDQVVGWIDEWANGGKQPGDNERDYLLACYIESLSQLNEPDISALANAAQAPALKAMFDDLERMPQAERDTTRRAMLEYVNKGGLMLPPEGSPRPVELSQLRQAAERDAIAASYSSVLGLDQNWIQTIEDTDRRYYTREHFRVAPTTFVEQHFEALITLGKQHDQRIRDILTGAKLGQRGVNDLIDREAMDRDLLSHRTKLTRWNHLLDCITADRVALVANGAFHKAAWYFDPLHNAQVDHAFTVEYACLKDICRSDEACKQLLDFMERAPQFSRPLYHTLPYSEQTALWVQYAFLLAAGMTVFNNTSAHLKSLRKIEQGRLPALDKLPNSTRTLANAAQNALTPALNLGLEKMFADFDRAFKGQAMPDLDQLFRTLPKALPSRILQAAQAEGVTFRFATPAEQASLRETLKEVLAQRAEMSQLKRQRNQINRIHGHRSAQAQALMVEIRGLRQLLTLGEGRLAASISPIVELPDAHARLYGSTPARAGLTVVFAHEQRLQVQGLMDNFRSGLRAAPVMNKLGDGAALLLFVAQAVNLRQVLKETIAMPQHERQWMPLMSAVFATGATGFVAAQGILDTALSAQAAKLKDALKMNALSRLHVTMGKLHIGLGIFTYFFGVLAAVTSFNSYHTSWVQAVRGGNRAAQQGAMLSMIGSGGLVLTNAYGLGNTMRSGYQVMMAVKGAARDAAWAASGTRLSTVFFRSNLFGGLFTLLELAGTWLYNRYNTSAHDQWLQSTPWGREIEKRKIMDIEAFQHHLTALLQAPFVQIKSIESESFWISLLPNTQEGEICVVLPGLNLPDFQADLEGNVRNGLLIGAQRITTFIQSNFGVPEKQRDVVTEQVQTRLTRVKSPSEQKGQGAPLLLKMVYPRNPERVLGKITEELLLVLELQSLGANKQLIRQTHRIRFNPLEGGRFPSAEHPLSNPPIPLLPVDVMALKVISGD